MFEVAEEEMTVVNMVAEEMRKEEAAGIRAVAAGMVVAMIMEVAKVTVDAAEGTAMVTGTDIKVQRVLPL